MSHLLRIESFQRDIQELSQVLLGVVDIDICMLSRKFALLPQGNGWAFLDPH